MNPMQNKTPENSQAEQKCPACGGNDGDMPCAYPGEHEQQPGCLRAARLPPNASVSGAEPLLAKLRLSGGLERILIRRKDMQANHEEARQLAEMKQQKSNLSRAYLEHCGALEACDIMLEVRDKMIDARTELLRRALPMLSGAGAGVLANEICECIGMRSTQS